MKTFIFIAAFFAVNALHAQSDKFTAAMQKNMALIDSAKTSADLENVSQSFERIGDAEKTQWLPYYYAAFSEVLIGFRDKSADKDKVAEKAKALIAKAEAIEKNAELCAITNMAATQQMLVDPQTRWQTYGLEASTALQTGMALDPTNPRLYYLKGQSLFGTPEQFGGGKEKAKPVFQKAVELYKTFQVKPLYPNWGGKDAEAMLQKCQ